MGRPWLHAGLLALVTTLVPLGSAFAHCVVGNRFFPATIAVDDPCVADELSLPTISAFKTGDNPAANELDVSTEFAKRITEDFGVSVGATWTRLKNPDGTTATGFQNLETAFQYQLLKDPAHEFALMASLGVEWGGTGASSVGADPFTTFTPTLDFGKGFGDLPDSAGWLRAFAITGTIGYAIPDSSSTSGIDPDSGAVTVTQNPRVLQWGGTLQYSMPYLKSAVVDLGLPDAVNHLIPLVEAQFSTPVSNTADSGAKTTGTINPGIIYVGKTYQVGLEAIVPIIRDSGGNVGVIAQLHLYLDDIFPNSVGRPLISAAAFAPGGSTP
ncbi:MAG TPA: hypothetical protein VE224_00350 [Pseudolabrys sp.]|nr:hypothetical protein [Pseudolabrys sp.]